MDKLRPKLKVKRQQLRRRRHQSAWITLDGGTAVHKCEVADVSQDGAKISLHAMVEIGGQFSIAFVPRGAPRRCEVAWRRGNMLGIKFTG
jgi:PilZ domain-containing protein